MLVELKVAIMQFSNFSQFSPYSSIILYKLTERKLQTKCCVNVTLIRNELKDM